MKKATFTISFMIFIIFLRASFISPFYYNNGVRIDKPVVTFQYKNDKFTFKDIILDANTKEEIQKIQYQLPEDLLKQFTTEELIYFSIDHPGLKSKDTESLLQFFNGFHELLSRRDLIDVIFEMLIWTSPIQVEKKELETNNYKIMGFNLKLLTFSNVFYKNLNNEQKKAFLQKAKKCSFIFSWDFFSNVFPEDRFIWRHFISVDGLSSTIVYEQTLTEEQIKNFELEKAMKQTNYEKFFDDKIKEMSSA